MTTLTGHHLLTECDLRLLTVCFWLENLAWGKQTSTYADSSDVPF